jgi:hypothetical protein
VCRGVASWFPRHSDNLGGERTRGKPIRGEGEVRDGKQAEGGDVKVIFFVCVLYYMLQTLSKNNHFKILSHSELRSKMFLLVYVCVLNYNNYDYYL